MLFTFYVHTTISLPIENQAIQKNILDLCLADRIFNFLFFHGLYYKVCINVALLCVT